MVIIDRTRCGLSCETGAVLFYPYLTQISLLYRLSGKNKGAMIILYCGFVNGVKNKKHKKQPWGNVECFAFGGGIVRFAPLETSFHAANHTLPPPPSYEGHPHCPKEKNHSPFHGEKPISWYRL